MKQFSPFFYKVTNLLKRNFLVLILISAFVQISFGQTATVSYSGLGTVTCPANPVATISTPPAGITFSQLSRGSGVTCSSVAGAITGTAFNGSLPTNITASKWYTFSITSDATSSFTLNNLNIVSRVSTASGSNSVSVQYKIGAGVLTNIGSFTPTGSAATYTITPSSPISVGASQVLNIFIIPNNLSASGTTCRVENNTSAEITRSGIATTDFANIQFPTTTQNILEGSTLTVFAKAYEPGVTDVGSPGAGLSSWIGYSSTNNNPSSAGWTWVPATFNADLGNDDEFKANLGSGLTPGTYYYASRFQISGGPFTYGGTAGNWNNDSVQLNVNSNLVDFCNIQSPASGTITAGGVFDVFAKVYEAGVTDPAGANANVSAWIGKSSTNTNPNTGSWTWTPATYNVQIGNDDEYQANIGTGTTAGTYYYASRFQLAGSTEFRYGGTGGLWNNDSGVLTVNGAPPVVSPFTLNGTFGVAFAGSLTATNGPISFAIISGGLPTGLNLNLSTGAITGTPAAAGSFTASVTASNGGGTSPAVTINFTIAKANQTITFAAIASQVYGTAPITLTATSTSGLSISYASDNALSGSTSGNILTIVGTGTANITASQAGDSNYNPATNVVRVLTVTPKPITISGLTADNKTQDGTTAATLSGTAILVGVLSGDVANVNLVSAPVANFASANVGTGIAVTVTGYSLSGSASANYSLSQPTGLTANINALTVPVATAATNIASTSFDANWNGTIDAFNGYVLDVSTSPTFGTSTPSNLTEGFIAGTTAPSGWTFTSIGGTYTSAGNFGVSSPSLQLDFTNDRVLSPVLAGNATQLSFWMKGNSTNATSGMLVEGFNGSTWVTIQNLIGFSLVGTTYTYNSATSPALPTNITQFRFTYTKTLGNIGFDDVNINYDLLTPSFIAGYNAFAIPLQATQTAVVSPVAANTTHYYRVRAVNGAAQSANSNVITVFPVSVGGTVSADQSICSGTTPVSLTLAGSFGTIIKWQSSSDVAFTTPIDIANTTTTLISMMMGSLTATTYYRAVVQSGANPISFSSVVTITVNPNVTPTFTAVAPICSGASLSALPTTSNNAITGTWAPALDNTTTTTYTFTPTSGLCATSTTLTITVNPNVTPTFSAVASICAGDSLSALPTTSNNAITGTWAPALDNTTTTTYTFTPTSGQCATSTTLTITVNPNVTPTFSSVVTNYCANEIIPQLPLISDNGIVGSWSPAIDNSISTLYTFTPSLGQCAITSAIFISVGTTFTWSGSPASWAPLSGGPSLNDHAVILSNYVASIQGDLAGCSLTVDNNAIVTMSAQNNLTLRGKLNIISGNVIIENNANLVQYNDIANTGNITVKRNSSNLFRLDYSLWSSPVVGAQTLLNFSPLTTQASAGPPAVASRFYVYNALTNTYNNSFNPASTSFASGKGYLIRMPNNWSATVASPYLGSFTGVPTNGNQNFTLANGGVGLRFNAIGNPYPSDISMSDFVAANTNNITGTLYFWRKTNSTASSPGYCTWAGGTFTSNLEPQVFNPNGIISVGQGFLVEAKNSATSVDFNNSMRVANNVNHFFRNSNTTEYNRIWLNVSGNDTALTSAKSQMAVGYNSNSTSDIESTDGKYFNNGDVALSSLIGNDKYAIQGRALPFNDNDVVPLSLKAANAGNYNIAIDHVDGLFTGNSEIYLRDNLTGTTNNLTTGAYNFATLAGDFDNRFELVYRSGFLATNQVSFNENAVIIYKNDAGININSAAAPIGNVKIFDIQGRLLVEKIKVNATQITIDSSAFANQVLIVEITSTSNIKVSKKVVN